MEPQLAMSLVLVVVLVASFVWFAHRTKSTPLPPRDQQEGRKALLVIGLIFWFLILGMGVLKGDLMTVHRAMSFAGCTVFVLAIGYGAFRRSTDTEAQKNYACERSARSAAGSFPKSRVLLKRRTGTCGGASGKSATWSIGAPAWRP